MNQDRNLFAESISVPEIIEQLDLIAKADQERPRGLRNS